MTYDLIVLGGGPAGYLAAERAGEEGLSVLLIEKRALGGVCLNEGCIPTKAMLYSAKIYDNAKGGDKYGIKAEKITLEHEAVVQRKNRVVKMLVSGVKSKLKKSGVKVIEAKGEVQGKNDEGYIVKADGNDYIGKRLVIATGSKPILPPIKGLQKALESGFVVTNREILDLDSVPPSLTIIGGGVIGLEMASYFNSAGSKVTVVEMLGCIAGNTDAEISDMLMNAYKDKGVRFMLNAKATEINGNFVRVESEGLIEDIESSKVLLSVGRKPVIDGLGIESIGVEVSQGRIKTDERCKTNIPEVYAAGDVNGISMLAHTAYREAEVCVNNIAGKKDRMRYNAIPSVIYTNPEVACVGESEESAKEKGIEYDLIKLSAKYSGRFVAENEGEDGLCKILVDKKHSRILGVHILGNYASEMIYGAAIMIETEMRVKNIKEIVFPHPTVSEVLREGLFMI